MTNSNKLQFKRIISEDYDKQKYTPESGEPIYDKVNNCLYIGNGTTNLSGLAPYKPYTEKYSTLYGYIENGILNIKNISDGVLNSTKTVNTIYDSPNFFIDIFHVITYVFNSNLANTSTEGTEKSVLKVNTGGVNNNSIDIKIDTYDQYGKYLPVTAVNNLYTTKAFVEGTVTTFDIVHKYDKEKGHSYKLICNSPLARWC